MGAFVELSTMLILSEPPRIDFHFQFQLKWGIGVYDQLDFKLFSY